MLVEKIAARLELACAGGAAIFWTEPERERRIILDVADYIENVVDCNPSDIADALHELSFWIWSLCRHGHWGDDSPLDFFLEMLAMATRDLAICTGLLSIGVELGGEWPVPWPDIRDENDEAPLLELLRRDRPRLEDIGRNVRQDPARVAQLREIAGRLRAAVGGP